MIRFKFSVVKGLALLAFVFVIISNVLAQDVSVSPDQVDLAKWLATNWELVALVFSEILAFLPGKYSGILKVLFQLAGKVIAYLARRSN